MPTLSRWFVKTALVYLLGGFVLGGGLLIGLKWKGTPLFSVLQPVYWHILLVGWLLQCICGVAYWMFPPVSATQPRRSPRLGWWTYGMLNLGLLLRVIVEPWHALVPQQGIGWLLIPAGLLQVLAVWLFVYSTWSRVRTRRA